MRPRYSIKDLQNKLTTMSDERFLDWIRDQKITEVDIEYKNKADSVWPYYDGAEIHVQTKDWLNEASKIVSALVEGEIESSEGYLSISDEYSVRFYTNTETVNVVVNVDTKPDSLGTVLGAVLVSHVKDEE